MRAVTINGLCGHAIDLPALLDATAPHGAGSSAIFYAKCVACGEGTELRLANGRVTTGYSYFGGSMHFEPVKIFRVGGLKVAVSDPDDLDVSFGERRWHFTVDTPSQLRFAVLGNAAAAGRALGELDFAQWGVAIRRVERNGATLEPDGAMVLRPGDFLHLHGPAPALTRAWHYMNVGKDRAAP